MIIFRPAFPNVNAGGVTKQLVSNQCCTVRCDLGRFPSHTRFGYCAVPVFDVVVATDSDPGGPPCAVTMLVSCQPPTAVSISRLTPPSNCRPRPNGRSYTALTVNRWEKLKSDKP